MDEFFSFILGFTADFCSFLLNLPFMPDFSFGHALVAITLLAVIITALVGTLAVASLSHEARQGKG